MNDSHRTVRGVDTLPPSTPGPECVDTKVLGVNVDVQLGADGETPMRDRQNPAGGGTGFLPLPAAAER